MSARKINFYLNSSDRLRSLTHAAQQIAELQRILVNTRAIRIDTSLLRQAVTRWNPHPHG